MQKFLGAFILGGLVGFACATTFGQKVVASPTPVQASPPAVSMAVDLPDDHVRHMRVHKKVIEAEEAPNPSLASGVAEQAKPAVDETPTGSLKRTRPKKKKLLAQKNPKKIVDEEDAAIEQVPPAEVENAVPRGFFETLFHAQ